MIVAISWSRLFFKKAHVLVIMAIQAEQFPVAAIRRIVVVVMIFVVNRQLSQTLAGKLATTSSANPWK